MFRDPAVLTASQATLLTPTAALELELCGLIALARDVDAASYAVECERTVDASFNAEDALHSFIGKLRDQAYGAGIELPLVRKVAA